MFRLTQARVYLHDGGMSTHTNPEARHMSTLTTQDVADRAVASLRARAEANDSDGPREWGSSGDPVAACRAYSAMLRTGAAWTTPNGVCVSVTGPDVSTWGYAAAEALDLASDGLTGEWVIGQSAPGQYTLEPA